MSESVGIIQSVTCRHPAGWSWSASNPEWSQLYQRLPVELPALPPLEHPALRKVPVDSIVWNPATVELYCIVVVVVIDPAADLLVEINVFISPGGRLVLRGYLVPQFSVVPIFKSERSGLEWSHDVSRQLAVEIFLTGWQLGGDWRLEGREEISTPSELTTNCW